MAGAGCAPILRKGAVFLIGGGPLRSVCPVLLEGSPGCHGFSAFQRQCLPSKGPFPPTLHPLLFLDTSFIFLQIPTGRGPRARHVRELGRTAAAEAGMMGLSQLRVCRLCVLCCPAPSAPCPPLHGCPVPWSVVLTLVPIPGLRGEG